MLKDQKILITGATGEVARAIAESLAPTNEVWAAARFTSAPLRKRLDDQGIRTFAWTLGEADFAGLPADFDHVIHAACNIFPVANDYDASIRANAEGTGLLIHHVRRAKSFLYVSSLAAYSEIAERRRSDQAPRDHGAGATVEEELPRDAARELSPSPLRRGRLKRSHDCDSLSGTAPSSRPDFASSRSRRRFRRRR